MKLREFIKKIMSSRVRNITRNKTSSDGTSKLEIGDIRKLVDKMQRNAQLDAPSKDILQNDIER